MLWENALTGLLEVFTAEDRMQHGGSKEKEGERNGGDVMFHTTDSNSVSVSTQDTPQTHS